MSCFMNKPAAKFEIKYENYGGLPSRSSDYFHISFRMVLYVFVVLKMTTTAMTGESVGGHGYYVLCFRKGLSVLIAVNNKLQCFLPS